MNIEVAKLNDRDAEGLNLNAYVDLGPDVCGAGAVGTNDGCGDQNYTKDSLNLIGELKNPADHARQVTR